MASESSSSSAPSSGRYGTREGVVAERSGDRVVVLHAAGDELSTLNPVGSIVWEHLPADRADLVGVLCERFPSVDRSVLESDLDRFLDQMLDRELIVVADADD